MTREQAISIIDQWDPDGPDLADEVAKWIAGDEAVMAAFEARFERSGRLDPIEVPEGAMARVLGAVTARPKRRGVSWTTLGLLAAAGLSVVVLGSLPMGTLLVMNARETPSNAPVGAVRVVDTGLPSTDASKMRLKVTGRGEDKRSASARMSKPKGQEATGKDGQMTAGKVRVTSSRIEIRDTVYFEAGGATVQPSSEPLLREVAQVLIQNPEIGQISVDGHTNSQGSSAFNLKLSQQRAEAVKGRLAELGVPPDRLDAVGFGEDRPVDSNETSEGRARNGRVEFRLLEQAQDPVVISDVVIPPPEPASAEQYTDYGHRDFTRVGVDPLSTFSVDVDTASYTLVRRKLQEGYLPPVAAVRVEEFVNYFPYDYPPPNSDPFAVHFEASPSPFNPRTHLIRVGVQGKKIAFDQRKSVHLTFLVDTSGSMSSSDKLGLVQSSLTTLTEELQDGDTVSIVAYAGSAGLVLAPTPMSEKESILDAIQRLHSGGSTAMGQGIELAYQQAENSMKPGAVNRVIICSDGDANVGPTHHQALSALIRDHARNGITLTTVGFGNGNYNDTTMEQLANDGDGNYYFIDSQREARRIFVDKLTGTLQVIAKDVKIQVDWTDNVEAYRLIGYENRDLQDHQFRDDAVDAGEIGSGHQVTALYEVALAPGAAGELATVRIRNKAPGPDAPASERSYALSTSAIKPSLSEGSRPYRIAVSAAYFAEILRKSPHTHEGTLADVLELARGAQRVEYPEDAELVGLIEDAARLSR